MSITIAVVIATLMFALGMCLGAMLQQAYSNNTQKILYQAYREARDQALYLERKIACEGTFKRNVIRSIKKISD
jgi:hypothetical protein